MTKLLKMTSWLLLLGVVSTIMLSSCKKKNKATEKPQFVAPLPVSSGDVLLAEVDVPYPLTFGYKGGKSVTITIEGMDPITENLATPNGTFTKNITFPHTGEYPVTIALTGTNGEVINATGGKFQVNVAGMNWIPNGDLVGNEAYDGFTSWTVVPAVKGDDGWAITQGGNTDVDPEVADYIAFWASSGNYIGSISQEFLLPNGTYTLSVRYAAGRGDEATNGTYDPSTVQVKAQGIGNDVVFNLIGTEFNADGSNIWGVLSKEITVTTGKCKLGVYIDASGTAGKANWVNIDYFKLIRK